VISGALPCAATSFESKTVNGVPLIAWQCHPNCHPPSADWYQFSHGSRTATPIHSFQQTVARVEQRQPALGAEIERILREIVFACNWLRRDPVILNDETSSIAFDHVYERQEGQPLAEPLAQGRFQRVVRRVGDAAFRRSMRICTCSANRQACNRS